MNTAQNSFTIITVSQDNHNVAGEVGRLVTTYVTINGREIELESFNRRGIEVYEGDEQIGYYGPAIAGFADLSMDAKMAAVLHPAVQAHMRNVYTAAN